MENDFVGKRRMLRVMLAILDQPYRYTKKELAELINTKLDNITNDFDDLKSGGLSLDYDKRYRYAFKESKLTTKLNDLLYFTQEDQDLLRDAIDQSFPPGKRAEQVKKKLDSLYDYHQLGLVALRKPNLKKIGLLKEAQSNKKVVKIYNYRSSNSNKITDRTIEPFHVSANIDSVQAYDWDVKKLRHFKISRMERIEVLEEDWQFEGKHNIRATDPFRIVDNKQELVHLRLKVGAYNELVERFPMAKNHIELSADNKDEFDFQCMVNHKFIGLTNFILGFYHQLVEVVKPESLIDHLEKDLNEILGNLRGGN